MRQALNLLMNTARKWLDDDAMSMGAALAFYSMLSLGPLVLLVLSGTALVFGEQAARGQMMAQIEGLVGADGALAVQQVLAAAGQQKASGLLATIIGFVTLLIGASAVFGQLQQALNRIWNVTTPPKGGFKRLIKRRLLSFSMVLGTGFLLLVSLLVSAALAAVAEFSLPLLPGGTSFPMQTLNQLVGFGVITGLFGVIFKYVPDTPVPWRDVWFGAAITAALFTVGKLAIGLYIGHSAMASAYGAAGSLVVLLVWVYYSSLILFFGAELTYAQAQRRKHLMEN